MTIFIRKARSDDVPRLVELNRAAYPDLVEEGVVFDEAQIRSHLGVFPRGQLVAEIDGRIVGAIATLVLPRAIDPLGAHTWMGVTDGGTFARHDDAGDTLYLADVYVDAAAWGRGVGRALYRALFSLCRELGLRRVVAGGRLYDYDAHAATLSPDEYVARVQRGELRDRVLVSQLRAGFTVRGLLADYLHDWRSRHWATLLVWENSETPTVAARFACERAAPGEPAV
ncbi:MAG TPA: GNAT family N-acetyltransferase [Polyangiaceae bacterium]|jgi:GNAT superfamily N-acetyltransferase